MTYEGAVIVITPGVSAASVEDFELLMACDPNHLEEPDYVSHPILSHFSSTFWYVVFCPFLSNGGGPRHDSDNWLVSRCVRRPLEHVVAGKEPSTDEGGHRAHEG